MGPLSSTSTTGSLLPVASGAYLRSSISSRLMKSVLRLVALVTTVNSPLTASRTLSMAPLARLAWSLDEQVRSLRCPHVRQVGMRNALRHVLVKQRRDIAVRCLLLEQLEPKPTFVDGGHILPA